MTDIPDDVMERAATEMANAAGAELAFLETAIRYYKPLARAVGDVFVEWALEEAANCAAKAWRDGEAYLTPDKIRAILIELEKADG